MNKKIKSIIKDFPRDIIFLGRVGSHLYGTATKDSDNDYVGVYMPHKEDILGLQYKDEIDKSSKKSNEKRKNNEEDMDCKLYSLRKFISLLSNNNPNIVEMLFVNADNTIIDSMTFNQIKENRDKFISRKIESSFTGYAYSQMQKLHVKKERYLSLQKAIEYLDTQFGDNKNDISLLEIHASELNRIVKHYMNDGKETASFHKGLSVSMIYDKIKKEYESYGWRVDTDTFHIVGYDVKFAYHAMRLMLEGLELMETERLDFPFKWEDLKYLKRIRKGKISLEQIQIDFLEANEVAQIVSKKTCFLRKKPDWHWINNWLINTQYNYWKKGLL